MPKAEVVEVSTYLAENPNEDAAAVMAKSFATTNPLGQAIRGVHVLLGKHLHPTSNISFAWPCNFVGRTCDVS